MHFSRRAQRLLPITLGHDRSRFLLPGERAPRIPGEWPGAVRLDSVRRLVRCQFGLQSLGQKRKVLVALESYPAIVPEQ